MTDELEEWNSYYCPECGHNNKVGITSESLSHFYEGGDLIDCEGCGVMFSKHDAKKKYLGE